MPTGNGWQSGKKWKYRDNGFTLGSNFTPGSGRPTFWIYCQYLLAAEKITPEMRFSQKVSEVEGAVVKMGQTQTDTITIDWTHIQKPEIFLNMFSGTAKLPNNRQLNIEVHEITGDVDLAERAFKHIVKSVNFKDNQLLQLGAEIVEKIKSKGLNSFFDNQNQQAFFLIKDSTERTIGFTMDVLIDSGKDTKLNIQAAGLFYIRGRQALEQVTSFQSENNLDKFVYKSERQSEAGSSGSEVILEEAGVITVRKFAGQPEEKNYHISPAAIPDVFSDQLLFQMLEANKREIVVDIIEADGKITPTLICEIDPQKDVLSEEGAAHIFKLELLDGQGFSENVYLNDHKQIYKRLAQHINKYLLESTSVENIIREFPNHAEYILKNSKMPKKNLFRKELL
ncbi:MAG: hypothetical protein ACYTFW_03375 [Planctomycetota bacterium]